MIDSIHRKFKSGNDTSVSQAIITRDEYLELCKVLNWRFDSDTCISYDELNNMRDEYRELQDESCEIGSQLIARQGVDTGKWHGRALHALSVRKKRMKKLRDLLSIHNDKRFISLVRAELVKMVGEDATRDIFTRCGELA